MTVIPSIALGLQYHTNIYRSEVVSTPAADLNVTPGVSATAAGDDHEFSANGEWTLQKYFFVGDNGLNTTLTSGQRLSNLDRIDQFHVGAGADLFKLNKVGLRLSDDLTQRNWVIDSPSANVPYTSQLRNAFSMGLRANPGPALELVPGFGWTYDLYRKPDFSTETVDDTRRLNGRNTFGPKLDAKWAFLPRTALVAHLTYEHNDWNNNTIQSVAGGEVGSQLDIPNSDFVRGLAGIDGRFTEKLFLQAMLGYGVGIFSPGSVDSPEDLDTISVNIGGLDGLLVKAQVKYQLTPKTEATQGSAVSVGYVKDFRSSFFTNYVAMNQVFAQFKGQFDQFEPSLRYELRFEDYEGEVSRNDIVNRLVGGVAWNAADYASVSGNLSWQQRASSLDNVEYDAVGLGIVAKFKY
ncbi:MAG: hypothetical protein H6738_13400 [Alphaproteobacteria bacterium]|nr:hypothetical protein [Alphaproteobacteria bacterium]MCB9697773.1 hypothetical protein [Alphaproteobacteria bacterium]